MKRCISSSIVLFLFACSNPDSIDLISERIKIVSPVNGVQVSEEIVVDVEISADETIKLVELWIDGEPSRPVDYLRPYSFIWSTIDFPDSSTHQLFVRAYFSDNRRVDSQKISLLVDNSSSRPKSSHITKIEYIGSTFIVQWTANEEADFRAYNIYESGNEDMRNARLIDTITNQSTTSYTVKNIEEEQTRYYQLFVEDIYGLFSSSNIKMGSSRSSILFISDRQGDDEIFWMLSDGSNQINLTNRAGDDYYPVYSPDRSMIAFVTERAGNQEIYIMASDGKKQDNLSNHVASDNEPSFAPDGQRIVFTSNRNLNTEIYSIGVNGESIQRLTNNSSEDKSARYFPDNQHMVFVSDRTGNEEIFIMDVDGNNKINLSNDPAADYWPVVSGDGSKLLFVSDRNGNNDIYIMNDDGSNQQQLTALSGNEGFPCFSPDNSRIAFQYDYDNRSQIFVINADGSNQLNISLNNLNDRFPKFLLNGQAILFQTQRDGNDEIYRLDLDSGETMNLSQNPATDRMPSIENGEQE